MPEQVEQTPMSDNENAIERLKVMIDKAVVRFDELQEFYDFEYGDFDTKLDDLKNEFCAFREYWIHKLKHQGYER